MQQPEREQGAASSSGRGGGEEQVRSGVVACRQLGEVRARERDCMSELLSTAGQQRAQGGAVPAEPRSQTSAHLSSERRQTTEDWLARRLCRPERQYTSTCMT